MPSSATRRPLRIAYLCADRGISLRGQNGSGVHIREFVAALCGRGHQVTVLAADPGNGAAPGGLSCPVIDLGSDAFLNTLRHDIAKETRADGSGTSRPAEIYSLLANQTLAAELSRRQGQFDLVYERYSLWSFAGLQFARREGLPYFLEVNAQLAQQQRAYRTLDLSETAAAIERRLFIDASAVLPTTEALASYVHSRGATRRRISVLPCGVARARFAPLRTGARQRDEFVIGFVGSLKPWHGIENVLNAFLQLSYRSSRYRLLIVGDGPMRGEIEAFCAQHHVTDSVELAGAVEHARVGEFLARMDVGIAPYPPLASFDYSPLKLWEYAAGGVPIVASASGELPRLFPHRVGALLHPPGSIGKIVKHIELLRANPDLAARLARRARRTAARYTWDRLAARFETLAARALRAGSSR